MLRSFPKYFFPARSNAIGPESPRTPIFCYEQFNCFNRCKMAFYAFLKKNFHAKLFLVKKSKKTVFLSFFTKFNSLAANRFRKFISKNIHARGHAVATAMLDFASICDQIIDFWTTPEYFWSEASFVAL